MKPRSLLILLLLSAFSTTFAEDILTHKDGSRIFIYEDHTCTEYHSSSISTEDMINKYHSKLRSGIQAPQDEIAIACAMLGQG